jgi:F-type H+-transporting ATPase subunit epsilon
LLYPLGKCVLLDENDQWIHAVVGNGFIQIINNRVTLLVDTAEHPEEIDERRARGSYGKSGRAAKAE